MTKAVDLRRSHARAALRELVDRLVDQCLETGREDLIEGAFILEQLARLSPEAMRQRRKVVLAILQFDDETREAGEVIAERDARRTDAILERLTQTVH